MTAPHSVLVWVERSGGRFQTGYVLSIRDGGLGFLYGDITDATWDPNPFDAPGLWLWRGTASWREEWLEMDGEWSRPSEADLRAAGGLPKVAP